MKWTPRNVAILLSFLAVVAVVLIIAFNYILGPGRTTQTITVKTTTTKK